MSDDGTGGAPGWAAPGAPPGHQGPPPGYQGPPPGPGWGPSPYGPPPQAYAAVKPGVVPLRPLSLMEILDGSVATARRHPKVTLGLSAVVVAVSTAISVVVAVLFLSGSSSVLDQSVITGDDLANLGADFLPYALVTVLLSVAGQVLLTGILTAVVGRAVLGRPVVLAEIWREVRPRLLTLLGLTLSVTGLIAVGAGLVVGLALLVALATATAAGVLVGVLLGMGLVVGAVWFVVMSAVAGPAVVLEKQGVRGAFRRSFRLVRGSFWRVLGVLLLVQVVAQVAGGILGIPFFVGSSIIAGATDATTFSLLPQVVSGLGSILAGTITYPITAGTTALLYVDLRMRREGLDLELARAAQQRPGIPTG